MSKNTLSTDVTGGAGGGQLPERVENPGLPPHHHRMGDHDPKAAKRYERQVVALFALSVIGTVVAIAAYIAFPADGTAENVRWSTTGIGLGIFLAMFGIGAAGVHWAKTLMSDEERSEPRHPQRKDEVVRAEAVAALKAGAQDSGIGRRGVLKGAVVSALALAPLGVAVPLIGEVGGGWNVDALKHTMWRRGVRLARDPSGEPIRAAEVTNGSVFHVIPETLEQGEEGWIEEKAKAIVLLVRIDPEELNLPDDRKDWAYEGIVAYSKVCTHVGCPVALYEQQTHHLLCPCHQSTFDLANGADVIFGPASRPLPQLPITVDDEGYLVAQSDFNEPVGPSYWERLR